MQEQFIHRTVCRNIQIESYHTLTRSTKVDRYIPIICLILKFLHKLNKNKIKHLSCTFSWPETPTLFTALQTFVFGVYFYALSSLAGSRHEKRSSGDHKTLHIKKRSHEDRGTNSHSQQPQYHARTSDGPGSVPHDASLLTAFNRNLMKE